MEKSFDILVQEYRPMLLTYVKAMVRQSALAEDIVQDTFLSAYRAIDSLQEDTSFGAWVRAIARNKVYDHSRSAKRKPLVVDSRILDGMEDVFVQFDHPTPAHDRWQDRVDVVIECTKKLPSNLRQAIIQVYQKGRTLKETATILDSTFGAINQRVRRGRMLIRDCAERMLGGVA